MTARTILIPDGVDLGLLVDVLTAGSEQRLRAARAASAELAAEVAAVSVLNADTAEAAGAVLIYRTLAAAAQLETAAESLLNTGAGLDDLDVANAATIADLEVRLDAAIDRADGAIRERDEVEGLAAATADTLAAAEARIADLEAALADHITGRVATDQTPAATAGELADAHPAAGYPTDTQLRRLPTADVIAHVDAHPDDLARTYAAVAAEAKPRKKLLAALDSRGAGPAAAPVDAPPADQDADDPQVTDPDPDDPYSTTRWAADELTGLTGEALHIIALELPPHHPDQLAVAAEVSRRAEAAITRQTAAEVAADAMPDRTDDELTAIAAGETGTTPDGNVLDAEPVPADIVDAAAAELTRRKALASLDAAVAAENERARAHASSTAAANKEAAPVDALAAADAYITAAVAADADDDADLDDQLNAATSAVVDADTPPTDDPWAGYDDQGFPI